MPFPDLHVLRVFYGLLPEPPADPFQFLLWEILSADALPARRDLAWQAFRRIPALTPDSVFRAPIKTINEAVGLVGPHRDERVEKIRVTTGEVKRHRHLFEDDALKRGGLLKAARSLRRLTEVPREVLDRALLFAAGYLVLPLDDSAARVVARVDGSALPISDGAEGFTLKRALYSGALRKQRRHARKVLAQALPKAVETYKEAVLYLRHHALHTCVAVGPHCTICPLLASCVFGRQHSEIGEMGEDS